MNRNFFEDRLLTLKLIFNRAFSDKLFLIFILFLILIFIAMAIFAYNNYIKPEIDNKHLLNKEFRGKSDDSEQNDALIIYFFTEWCPYCKKAKPEWDKFQEYVKNVNNTNDYKINLLTIDCDKKPEMANKYNIEGYPTIKLIHKGKTYDYDAKPDKQHLVDFLESSIN